VLECWHAGAIDGLGVGEDGGYEVYVMGREGRGTTG